MRDWLCEEHSKERDLGRRRVILEEGTQGGNRVHIWNFREMSDQFNEPRLYPSYICYTECEGLGIQGWRNPGMDGPVAVYSIKGHMIVLCKLWHDYGPWRLLALVVLIPTMWVRWASSLVCGWETEAHRAWGICPPCWASVLIPITASDWVSLQLEELA